MRKTGSLDRRAGIRIFPQGHFGGKRIPQPQVVRAPQQRMAEERNNTLGEEEDDARQSRFAHLLQPIKCASITSRPPTPRLVLAFALGVQRTLCLARSCVFPFLAHLSLIARRLPNRSHRELAENWSIDIAKVPPLPITLFSCELHRRPPPRSVKLP